MKKKGFKMIIAMGMICGLIIASSDGNYFPIVNIFGLILMMISCFGASKIEKRE